MSRSVGQWHSCALQDRLPLKEPSAPGSAAACQVMVVSRPSSVSWLPNSCRAAYVLGCLRQRAFVTCSHQLRGGPLSSGVLLEARCKAASSLDSRRSQQGPALTCTCTALSRVANAGGATPDAPCTICPAGFFSRGRNLEACKPCKFGYTSAVGSTDEEECMPLDACPAGTGVLEFKSMMHTGVNKIACTAVLVGQVGRQADRSAIQQPGSQTDR